ncbi:hypothetical protein AB0B51_08705 [Streptomyces griseus]|uniref:hypothetical protein n=1 Tax=Streptomyces griseus TaxID=1911 RepID=UPI000B2ED3A1|nr:hypothetical protein [Streptomyces griseus]
MSDESTPDVTWEDIADSWRVDELLEGRMRPSTYDDVLTLMTVGVLRGPMPPPSETARRRAFNAMMRAADGRTGGEEEQSPQDPDGIEQTRLAMLRAFEEARRQREE